MGVLTLSLHSFRSYDKAHFVFNKPLVFISGHNGLGKTNILEALSLLSPGKGLRGAPFSALLHQQKGASWHVSYAFTTESGPLDIGMTWHAENNRRTLTQNGVALKSQMALTQWIRLLWMTPAMERLWNEGNSGRRRYFDRVVFTVFPEYAPLCLRYEKAMKERLHLLLEGGGTEWLKSLENILAETMIHIATYRQKTLALLEEPLQASCIDGPIVLKLSGAFENTSLEKEAIMAQLYQRRTEDRMRKSTSWGPHRSVFEVFDRRLQEASLCSTGEQKTLLFSITLALARLLRQEYPHHMLYLLMDELMAHVDEKKQLSFIDTLLGLDFHVWITGTESPAFLTHDLQRLSLS